MKLYQGVKDGRLVDVADVDRGRACGCHCAHCRQPLIAKKGPIRRHHFAHDNRNACARGMETTLHRAAKEVLASAGQLWIPPITLKLANKSARLREAGYISLDRVTLERRMEEFIPDVIVECQGTPLMIEIKVTHGVDDAKLAKIRSGGISALEIDLSRTARKTTLAELSPLIVDKGEHKRWLYSKRADRTFERLKARSTRFQCISRGLAIHVDGCPIAVRRWRGKPYANVLDDCVNCQHSVEVDDPFVYCLAPLIPPGTAPAATMPTTPSGVHTMSLSHGKRPKH